MLEVDHVIWCVPGPGVRGLEGFTIEPGRVHEGQGTRNVRVMFERSYLEVLWVEDAGRVAARGLDFGARCGRPARACPFGCVLRGRLTEQQRERFRRYELPDAPVIELLLLREQPRDAPFVAVFETDEPGRNWPVRTVDGAYLRHPNGAREVRRARFWSPGGLEIPDPADVSFERGPARLELDLGELTLVMSAEGAALTPRATTDRPTT